MKVLCVAEKPSIAKSITEILSGGHWQTVSRDATLAGQRADETLSSCCPLCPPRLL
jgi:DNA topoisomerase IA